LNPGATLDLNGNTQTAGLIQDAGAAAGARLVTSAAPATLTVVQGADTLYSGVFRGALSFVKDGAGTLTLSNAAHATIGAVTVRNGTLALAPGCSFAAAASFAVEGGLLALRTAAALPDTATLDISGSGRMRVEAGIEEAVDRLLIDGAEQASGAWGASGSGAEHVDDVHFEGGGRVRVLHATPAAIALQPAPVTAAIGGGASFAVAATGQAPLFYQWYRDGVAIAGATGSVYALEALTLQDDGAIFSVTVSNALGVAASPGVALRVTDPTRHSLPYTESFESYAAGLMLAGIGGWRGAADAGTVTEDAALLAALRAYAAPVGLPLRRATHAKAANFFGALTNRLLSATGRSVWCDLMVNLTPMTDGLQSPSPDSQCALAADGQGFLAVWHRDLAGGTNRWSALAWRAATATAQWVRVTLHLDYATYDAVHAARYFRVFADGAEQSAPSGWSANDGAGTPGGPWFALTAGAQGIGEMLFSGDGAVDDLVVSWDRPLIGLGPRGTPEWWLADNGLAGGLDLAADEAADADGDGFANWMEYAAGTGPNDAADLLRFTGAPRDPATGRLTLAVQTMPGRRYGLLSSGTLGAGAAWAPEPFSLTPGGPAGESEAAASSGTLTLYVGDDGGDGKFYRALALP
jgi:autotransporter-associated beta strand protein